MNVFSRGSSSSLELSLGGSLTSLGISFGASLGISFGASFGASLGISFGVFDFGFVAGFVDKFNRRLQICFMVTFLNGTPYLVAIASNSFRV